MGERAGYLPHIEIGDIEWRTLHFQVKKEALEVKVPLLSAEQLEHLAEHLTEQRKKYLHSLPIAQIVDSIDRTIELLLDRSHPLRQKAEQILPIVTGFDPEMVRLGLTSYLKTFRKAQLLRFLEEDFANPGILDDFKPRAKGGFAKAHGPDLIAHCWASNVPGLPLWSLISGLLVKSANIGKVSSSEPLFAGWFAQALEEVDPRLAACLAIVWWKGGDIAREQTVFRKAQLVIGYGSNKSLDDLRTRIPLTTRSLLFGHKVSFGIIGKEALDARKASIAAHQAAYDIVRYEQQGCYSPHLFFVEKGGQVSPLDFAHYVGQELSALEHKFPRRDLELEEKEQLTQARQAAELEMLQGKEVKVLGDSTQPWTVVYEERLRFMPSPLYRFIRVVAVEKLEEIAELILPFQDYLQTAAVAASPKRLFQIASLLGNSGVTRICALGQMTSPEAGWHHDGRFNLLDLVRMVEIEASAEASAESYAPYYE